jgi:hypothetical protein
MIAADLNRDHRPEIIVGYVNAPGWFISTTAQERNISSAIRGWQGSNLWHGGRRSGRRRLAGCRGGEIGRAEFCDVQSIAQEMKLVPG